MFVDFKIISRFISQTRIRFFSDLKQLVFLVFDIEVLITEFAVTLFLHAPHGTILLYRNFLSNPISLFLYF